ncbi:hypothetical protein [Simkania negevensis]|uniref:Uncharacterized protein n=1 Tax=Simkania negevensis (strain ATCC VR-1471 / DSM 27360 / Z) TaxID=331113 RepID=F8L493_SIMNZ|nr:hypothetical protein [Simkania negevensis]CCB90140.1 unknown protein [Simkania negevensis Z]
MSSYLTNLTSVQTPLTVVSSVFSGVATAYAKNYPIKNAAIISGITGFTASVTTSALDPETRTIYKILLAAATVVGTLMALQSASQYLETKFGFVIEPKLVSYLTVTNVVGVAISFVINRAKPLLDVEAFDKHSDEEVKALHTRMLEEGNKEFAESSKLLQLRMVQRFAALGLDVAKFEAKLTAEVIKGLSKAEVEYLFKFRIEADEGKPAKTWTSWVDSDETKNALILRFLACRLINSTVTKEDLEAALKVSDLPKEEFELPTTVEAIKALNTTDSAFYREVYKILSDKWAELSIGAQWELVQAKPADLPPTFDALRIKDAPKAAIEWYIGDESPVKWREVPRPMQEALKARCADEKIELNAALNPEKAAEVEKLEKEEVKAYFTLFASPKFVKSLSDEVAAAFMLRFFDMELDAKTIPLEVFTPERVASIHLPASGPEAQLDQLPAGKLPWVHRIYQALPENWYILYEKDRHTVLSKRFGDAKLEELFMPRRKQSDPLPDSLDTKRHHAAFTRVPNGDTAWRNFTNSQQKTFNERFEAAKLSPLGVTSYWY